jgi:predicted MPP superfamily phosphohydrolase
MRGRIAFFVAIIQAILLASHWFVYRTWTAFQQAPDPPGISTLGLAVALLSVTFVAASLLAWRYSGLVVRLYYTAAAVWLGVFNFFFLAACASWIVYGLAWALRLPWQQDYIAFLFFGLAIAASVYGLVNSARVRVRRIPVKLPNLPASWRGRVAALVTDTHLGHVRGVRFAKRIVAMVSRFKPDIILIAGDLYDGTAANARELAEPLRGLSAPHGAYFIAGNHEEFGDHTKYLEAVGAAGVRVLNNEKVTLDGLQVVGVHYRDAVHAEHLRAILQSARLDRKSASILLTHAPDQLAVAADEGIGLQVSGHTHGGQFFPFTLFIARVYGAFVYGLNQLGNLLVYTSCGAGTWGPPLRVGTRPEIVLFKFE